MAVDFFDPIIIDIPSERIYSRLGYSKGVTSLTDAQRNQTEKYIEQALGLIKLKGAGSRVPIQKIEGTRILLSGDISFESKSLSEFFSDSKEVFFMAATVGSKIVESICENSKGKDVTGAVVLDAVASEMVDSAFIWIMDYYNQQLSRENKHLTKRRFSAGYGDFLLDNQEIICKTLELKKLGVTLTKSYILIPEKSVTALAGILYMK